MFGNQPAVGDRVHHEDRKHPTKDGWLQANGQIVNLIMDQDGFWDDVPEVDFVVVEYDKDDIEVYSVDELEWTPMNGGYWRVA